MSSVLKIVALLSVLSGICFARIVQNEDIDELGKTVQDLKAKGEQQQNRITQLESLLEEHLQSHSLDNQHHVAKRAASMPVAFSANLHHNEITHVKGAIIRFDHVTVNDGGGYKSSTGVFIAPQAGLYFFTWMFLPEPGYVGTMALYKNGVMERQSDSTQPMAGNSAILRLNREDQIWLATYRDVDGIHENHSAFCGFRFSD